MEKPFNLTIAILNSVNGKLSKSLPPKASKIAKLIDPKKISFLIFFDILLEDVLTINFSRK
tara:strand:- start:458 stop:640 length:183 start_codon:yes stop_codon:yes gene_type:complete